MLRFKFPIWTFILALGLSSCATPVVKELTRPITESKLAQALVSDDKLSVELQAYLKSEGVDEVYRRSPSEAVQTLANRLSERPSVRSRNSLAQICSKTGDRLRGGNPEEAVGFYLEAARLSVASAVASADQPEETPMRIVYNHASSSIACLLFDMGSLTNQVVSIDTPVTKYTVQVRSGKPGFVTPSFVDSLVPADNLQFKGIKTLTRIRASGVGGALVGHRRSTEERRVQEPLLNPRIGMSLPMTATLDFVGDRSSNEVSLMLHDTLLSDDATLRGTKVPLAADLTAPLAILYNYAERGNVGLRRLLYPAESESITGLYQLEPFRQDEIPVVLVHGLNSSPETWLQALNRLRADPVLRDRYQLLVFAYPTGFPIGHNAAALREHLSKFQKHFDPDRTNPAMRKMVLVGHSMGGILSNYQIRDSKQIIHDKLFDRPLDELDFTEFQKSKLRRLLYFNANPDVSRVIFVASPHDGSKMAGGRLAAIGASFIRLPFEALFGERFHYVDGMTDLARELVNNRPNSVANLRPGSLALTIPWALPNTYDVPLHSIIAQKDSKKALEESSDGVVQYQSAHFDGAATEEIVVGESHGTINKVPNGIAEVRRILLLHLNGE